MRSLAVKIFLAFWLIHAVIFIVLTLTPDQGRGMFLLDQVRRDGEVATALLANGGPERCASYLSALDEYGGRRLAVYDAQRQLVCGTGLTPALASSAIDGADGSVTTVEGLQLALVRIQGRDGTPYSVVGTIRPGPPPDRARPRGYNLLLTTLLVSGVVCFFLARYLAYPLGLIRAATHRLAGGDLEARVGPRVGARQDEVGDLVRDFDAMADRIASLIHSQTQLLSDISHELRSPLARLSVALELARRKAGPAASAELDRIQTETDRVNELIGQVLALARAEGDRRAARAERVDVAALVRDVSENADYEARQQGKSVEVRTDGPADATGDPDLLASAIENVVRNAVRYTPADTAVTVVVSADDATVSVSVRDHGPGVPDAELEKIFAPFHRVGSARTRESGGTGLGLAIARRAIAVHGGTIGARNHADGGLDVSIRVPR